ncbi:hypothetical protein vseg_007992 [Gypsophila vaccaria]
MATSFMTAAQVGSYFVTQYYSMLQQRPEYVHQLYSDSSTMLRIDGHVRDAASAMLQIHTLVMSTRFTSIEIKTIHSLESWNGGVLVMVTGSLQMGDFSGRRKFAQTFFLAPQEKGFFVLTDILHFIEDDQIYPYSASLMGQPSVNANLNATSATPDPVSSYMMTGGMQYMPSAEIKENGGADKYSMSEQRLQQAPEVESILEDHSREQGNGFLENQINPIQEAPHSPIEESAEEPQKHTYASILRAAKAQVAPPLVYPSSSDKSGTPVSDWQHAPQQIIQQSAVQSSQQQQQQQPSSTHAVNDSLTGDMGEEFSTISDIGEIKSVYVRNLLPNVSSSELEEEFKKFGQLSSEGVAIRRLKDTDVCYAFVEFEDIASVQGAIKAGSVQIGGRQLYIEERRANSSFARGRRGRGRASYQPESSRGRFGGRSYSRGGANVGGERDFNRTRGNGFYR